MNKCHLRPSSSHHRPLAALVVASALLLCGGCDTMSERQRGTAQGAGVGAVAGAILGASGGNAGRGAVIGGALGAVAGNLWSKRMEDKQRELARASAGTGVVVDRTPDNRIKLNVPSDVSFDSGRADIRPQMRPVLDELSRNLDPNMTVTVVGHTDNTGNDSVNLPLSQARAEAVRDYLGARGVHTSRITVHGRGPREPVASNDSETGRAANRRVEIFLSESTS